MARVLSTVLARDRIAHQLAVGSLQVDVVGTIPYHWWVQLRDGTVCDLRAQMWLGKSAAVPHGQFQPRAHQHYLPKLKMRAQALPSSLFEVLAGAALETFFSFRKALHG